MQPGKLATHAVAYFAPGLACLIAGIAAVVERYLTHSDWAFALGEYRWGYDDTEGLIGGMKVPCEHDDALGYGEVLARLDHRIIRTRLGR